MMNSFLASLFEGVFRLYQWVVSPMIHMLAGPGYGCRFFPSCSEYGRVSFQRFEFSKALKLTLQRILRCRPGCPGGFDPVPERSGDRKTSFLSIENRLNRFESDTNACVKSANKRKVK